MYSPLYFLVFYAAILLGFLIVVALMFVFGFFKKDTFHKSTPKNTLQFLLEQVKNSDNNKEILDSVMKEFYANFYTTYKESPMLDTWLELIQNITIFDYMTVEQVAKFRDDLILRNPSLESEIKLSIGESLKYRENLKKKG